MSALPLAVVHSPTRVGDGPKAHIVYSIDTAGPGALTVTRRYNEFASLRAALVREHGAAVLVPALPARAARGRFNHDFVRHRALLLQQFLRAVQSLPPLASSSHLRAFMLTEPPFPEHFPPKRLPASSVPPAAIAASASLSAERARLQSAISGLEACVKRSRAFARGLDAAGVVAATQLGPVTSFVFEDFGAAAGEVSMLLQEQANVATAGLGDALRSRERTVAAALESVGSVAMGDGCLESELARLEEERVAAVRAALAAHVRDNASFQRRLCDAWKELRRCLQS